MSYDILRFGCLGAAELSELVSLPVVGRQRVVLTIAPCRSGTTATLRLFGASGIESYYQPIKNILRWWATERETSALVGWHLPDRPVVYVKETLGPYSLAESTLNPLSVLLHAATRQWGETAARNWIAQQVTVIAMTREPLATWSSWLAKWEDRVPRPALLRHFLASFRQVETICEMACDLRVPLHHYAYEANRDPQAPARLFAALGLPMRPRLTGWSQLPGFGQPGSNVVLPREPHVFRARDIGHVQSTDGLVYRERDTRNVRSDERQAIDARGLPALHALWRAACTRELGAVALAPLAPPAHDFAAAG